MAGYLVVTRFRSLGRKINHSLEPRTVGEQTRDIPRSLLLRRQSIVTGNHFNAWYPSAETAKRRRERITTYRSSESRSASWQVSEDLRHRLVGNVYPLQTSHKLGKRDSERWAQPLLGIGADRSRPQGAFKIVRPSLKAHCVVESMLSFRAQQPLGMHREPSLAWSSAEG
jgi:hypothetical protein